MGDAEMKDMWFNGLSFNEIWFRGFARGALFCAGIFFLSYVLGVIEKKVIGRLERRGIDCSRFLTKKEKERRADRERVSGRRG